MAEIWPRADILGQHDSRFQLALELLEEASFGAFGEERESRANNAGVYLVGALGGAKMLLFRRHDPDPDGPHWSLFLAKRKPRERQPAAPNVSPAGAHRATQHARTRTAPRHRPKLYPEALASGFEPVSEITS
jgi:hypothetical protein